MRPFRASGIAFGSGLALLFAACGASPLSPDDAGVSVMPEGGPEVGGTGATCGVLIDAGPSMAVFNPEALECLSRMCIKPTVQSGAVGPTNTGGYCTAECSQDSDCAGQLRDPANPADARCQTGFACGTPFVKGQMCCRRLCLCKDFLGSSGAPTPISCQGNAAASCAE